jgi:SAM-dependent methyltransferase
VTAFSAGSAALVQHAGMSTSAALNFGYPWWLSYGHLVILVPAALALLAAFVRRWPVLVKVVLGMVTAWALVAFLIVRSFGFDAVPPLPTEGFLRSGSGHVLDIGAGTGRSSIMVLTARPNATLVASDLFGESFEHHFGPGLAPQDRLRANLETAGMAARSSIETADMRRLPFEPASFDAIVSAYAMDHVGGDGATQALAEAARVLKPGGDFLLILVANDGWTTFAFGPLLAHAGTRGPDWWRARVGEAGFQTVEEGRLPATVFFLLSKR